MQKGDISKLTLLLAGISARMQKNDMYFIAAQCTFSSGKKTFHADIKRSDGAFLVRFQGTQQRMQAEEVCDFFKEQAQKHETARLTYQERGHTIVISVEPRGVTMKQQETQENTPASAKNVTHPLLDATRAYCIQIDKAEPLLTEIGILTAEGKLKNDMIRKYNQIDHFVELVGPMFEQDDSEEIVLLDCACGKSYLSFVMNFYLREVLHRRCRIIGVDINSHVIEESQRMAQRLGYHNMVFQQADLRTYTPPGKVTAVISLHACDIATDLALATAINAKAKYVACVPCCHKELLHQYALPEIMPLAKHGVFRARFNDLLTDSMRVLKLEAEGYRVSPIEYVSPIDTPKNLLIRAVRTNKPADRAKKEYESVRNALGTTSELDRLCK